MNHNYYIDELPDSVIDVAGSSELPAFLYDVDGFRRTVAQLVESFGAYAYPVKANPHPAFIRAAFEVGADVDACSPGDIELAVAAGFTGPRISYTAPYLDEQVVATLGGLGARVDINCAEDAAVWHRLTGRPFGARLVDEDDPAYDKKFGLRVEALLALLDSNAGYVLEGVHVHGSHSGLSPRDAVERIGAIVCRLPEKIVSGLDYVNVGGGWSVGAHESEKAALSEYVVAVGLLHNHLAARGFDGTIIVEPGDWAAIDHGWWMARVASVRQRGNVVVILDTNTPMPSRGVPTPLSLLRGVQVVHSQGGEVACDIYGSANNQRDLFGSEILMPEPAVGDTVIFTRCGAYVRSLIGSFNERPVPGAICL